jgi:hypothetical protein
MFYLSVEFDAPQGRNSDAQARWHLVLTAYPESSGALDPPCAGAQPSGSLPTTRGTVDEFSCPDLTTAIEAEVHHGEGVNANHDLIRWYGDGVTYALSAHRSGLDNQAFLSSIMRNMDYIRAP